MVVFVSINAEVENENENENESLLIPSVQHDIHNHIKLRSILD